MHQLKNLYIYTTWRCNLYCKHCWVSAGSGNDCTYELERERYIPIVQEACQMGVNFIKVSGGEPLLRLDVLKDIIEEAKKYDCEIMVETNVTLMTREAAKALSNCIVSVSIDGIGENHNQMRGSSTAFQDTMNGIRMMKEYGISPHIVYSFCEYKEKEINDVIELLEELELTQLKLNPIMNIGRAKKSYSDRHIDSVMTLSAEKLMEIKNKFCVKKRDHVTVRMMLPMCYEGYSIVFVSSSKNIVSCPYDSLLSILPNGTVGLCGEAKNIDEFQYGNICENTLESIWNQSEKMNELMKVYDNNDYEGVCRRCPVNHICHGSCRVVAYHYQHTIHGSNPLCGELLENHRFPYKLKEES